MQVGEKAPYFETVDAEENEVKLEEGKKHVLAFMRYMGCIWCQMDIIRLMKEKDKLADTNVFIFVQSPAEVVKGYLKEFPDFPFRLIPDPRKEIYKLYGVGRGSFLDFLHPITLLKNFEFLLRYIRLYKPVKGGIRGDRYLRPAFFGVDSQGKLTFAYRARTVADTFDIKELISSIS